MTRLAFDEGQVAIAALAISIGILSNTALKSGLVLAIGEARYRIRALAGLALLAAGSGIGIFLGTR
jgi:hypothetical protein